MPFADLIMVFIGLMGFIKIAIFPFLASVGIQVESGTFRTLWLIIGGITFVISLIYLRPLLSGSWFYRVMYLFNILVFAMFFLVAKTYPRFGE